MKKNKILKKIFVLIGMIAIVGLLVFPKNNDVYHAEVNSRRKGVQRGSIDLRVTLTDAWEKKHHSRKTAEKHYFTDGTPFYLHINDDGMLDFTIGEVHFTFDDGEKSYFLERTYTITSSMSHFYTLADYRINGENGHYSVNLFVYDNRTCNFGHYRDGTCGTGNNQNNNQEDVDRVGWYKVDSKWYYANGSGRNMTGWIQVGGKEYYMNDDGVMQTGWTRVNYTWFYLGNDGAMKTGWQKINNTWYYMNSSGAMRTGWLKSNNKWYYLKNNGAMAIGWQKVGNRWFYMNSSGVMQTGWLKLNNKWYYLAGNGAMHTGWQRINNTWYYMNSSGVMQTRWLHVNGDTYYLTSSGAMVTGDREINGKKYTFDQSGRLREDVEENVKQEITYKERVEDVEVKYPTIRQADPTLPKGQTKVLTPGVNGLVRKTYTQKYVNGKLAEETLKSEKTIRESEFEILLVGTKSSQTLDMETFDMSAYNKEFLALVNAERARVGVAPLTYKADLQKGADIRTAEMAKAGYPSHTRPNGERFYTAFNYLNPQSNWAWGENASSRSLSQMVENEVIAGKTTYEKAYAKRFYDGYVGSSGHYKTMMNPNYKSLVVSLDYIGADVYSVMIFSNQN